MQGYTTIDFNIKSLNIPNDRIDLIESANALLDFAKKTLKSTKKIDTSREKEKEEFLKYAGAFDGIFENTDVNQMRINKALRQ